MTVPISPDLESAFKTLWGASQPPFSAAVSKPYASKSFTQFSRQHEQLVAVRACGLVHGPNGVGKTLLVQHFLADILVGATLGLGVSWFVLQLNETSFFQKKEWLDRSLRLGKERVRQKTKPDA